MDGWRWCEIAAGAHAGPADVPAAAWSPCARPASVAWLLAQAGGFDAQAPRRLDGSDFWFARELALAAPHRLRCEMLAGDAEIWWRGAVAGWHRSMFVSLELDLAPGAGTFAICVRGEDAVRRDKLPRARWRVKMIDDASLRGRRQTLLGHMPGWLPAIPALGCLAPLAVEPAAPPDWQVLHLAADFSSGGATLALTVAAHAAPPQTLRCAGAVLAFVADAAGRWTAAGPVPDAAPWLPHTHGAPALYPLTLHAGEREQPVGPIGFRRIETRPAAEGFGLIVNGIKIFARGVCWTPPDLLAFEAPAAAYDAALTRIRDAGMNMVRVPGSTMYERRAFFDACDRLGILVWHDFMFANLDYPVGDPGFRALVAEEAAAFLDRTRHHPSLAVLCGGSEVRQQAEMLGLAWTADEALFACVLAEAAAARPDVPYVPNTPWGPAGAPAFATDDGVAHYYGFGAYLRPETDVRRAEVKFAAECFAVAHLPAEADLPPALAAQPLDAAWKRGTPRDMSAPWDFDDVRDHYLGALYGEDPARLRREDPARYLDLGRAVSCDMASALFSEWRRPGSACAGGLVWQLRDARPGAGWGLWTEAGVAKPVWHALSRVFRPVQLLLTDEGLNGLGIHLLNETDAAIPARLEIRALRDGAVPVAEAARAVVLPARSEQTLTSGAWLGRFFDATYAYRFGPPAHTVTVAVLRDAVGAVLSAAYHLPSRRLPRAELGFEAALAPEADGYRLSLTVRRFAQYVHLLGGVLPADDWFHLAPGVTASMFLRRVADRPAGPAGLSVTALNAAVPLHVPVPDA